MRKTTPLVLLLAVFAYTACNDTTTAPNLFAPDGASFSATSLSIIAWQGHGSDHLPCETGYHWILAPGGGSTSPPLFVSSETPDGAPMFRMGSNAGDNAAWHYNSGLVDLAVGSAPYVSFEGSPHASVKLTISNCLDNGTPDIPLREFNLRKTAETSYDRVHRWDIAKKVETANGHKLNDDTPKVWLYTDGSGNEKGTWTVDVSYMGFIDRNILVTGTITASIPEGRYVPALITGMYDAIGGPTGKRVAVICEVEFPYLLEAGEELVCTYSTDLATPTNTINEAWVTGEYVDGVPTALPDDKATADVIFGAPASEEYATVNIRDISDLFGTVALGTVTAPNNRQFTYDKEFAYADYGQPECGAHRYDNTASIVETNQDASAVLAVNVQCYEFESAWAMGTGAGVTAKSFCDNGFSNWGWTNAISQPYTTLGWPLYAGAAQCDPVKGTLVGHFKLTYNGGFAYEFVKLPGMDVLFEGAAVYADTGMFPVQRNGRATVSPGQYYIANPLTGAIHVIAHVNAGIPDPNFGPQN
jgi:hypothetical protein